MESVLIKAGQLILSLSILVVLHELGHFIPAKLFKTRVEKFYLFFNPWFSLFKIKRGDTEYGIGWLPLGGFVKISGMIDESMDKSQMQNAPQPWEFRSKPAWQRLIIMVGGVVVNLVVGAICFTMVVYVWGESKLDLATLNKGMYVSEVLHPYGLQTGDKVLEVEGKPVKSLEWLNEEVLFFGGRSMMVLKPDGTQKQVSLPKDIDYTIVEGGPKGAVFGVPISTEVGNVPEGYPAYKSGIRENDVILKVNGVLVDFWQDMSREIRQQQTAEPIAVAVLRGMDTLQFNIAYEKDDNGNRIIGVGGKSVEGMYGYTITQESYSFFQSTAIGVSDAMRKLSANVLSFKFLFTKTGASQMGGMISIGNMFPPAWNWQVFWYMTGMLSLVLAFMNILPIPALDGGHVMFLIYEIVVGKKPHDKVLEYAQVIGMMILLGLMLFANGNDIVKLIAK